MNFDKLANSSSIEKNPEIYNKTVETSGKNIEKRQQELEKAENILDNVKESILSTTNNTEKFNLAVEAAGEIGQTLGHGNYESGLELLKGGTDWLLKEVLDQSFLTESIKNGVSEETQEKIKTIIAMDEDLRNKAKKILEEIVAIREENREN